MTERLGRLIAGPSYVAAGAALWIEVTNSTVIPQRVREALLIVALVCVIGGTVILLGSVVWELRHLIVHDPPSAFGIQRRYVQLWTEAEALIAMDWSFPTPTMESRRDRFFVDVGRAIRVADPGQSQIDLMECLREGNTLKKIVAVREILNGLIAKNRPG